MSETEPNGSGPTGPSSTPAASPATAASSSPRRSPLPPLPESLLSPLLDTAADVLRSLEPQAVPVSLRRLAGFDRKGLTRGAARQQLLKAIQSDDAFHEEAIGQFVEQPEVEAALDAWDPAEMLQVVDDAAKRADLALLASALYAARPRGWAFGLGAITAVFERQRLDQEESDELHARDLQIAALEESRRRADAGRIDAEQAAGRLERELKEERSGRRAREEQSAKEVAAARKETEDASRQLAKAKADNEAAEARLAREAERARAAEQERRDLRRELAETQRKLEAKPKAPVLRPADLQALVDAGRSPAGSPTGWAGSPTRRGSCCPTRARPPRPRAGPVGSRRGTPGRSRAGPPVARWRRSRRGCRRTTRRPSTRCCARPTRCSWSTATTSRCSAWGEASPSEQRDRLLAALAGLQMRTRSGMIVVFDGADVEGVRPPRRPGLKVIFSPADEEADAVVVREAASLPLHVPAIVVSSDGWVSEKAKQAGARVVASATLLQLLRWHALSAGGTADRALEVGGVAEHRVDLPGRAVGVVDPHLVLHRVAARDLGRLGGGRGPRRPDAAAWHRPRRSSRPRRRGG